MPVQASAPLGLLKDVKVVGRQQDGPIEIFHLRWNGVASQDYLTLDEALAASSIEITEFTEAGDVPRLKIVNRSEHKVFIMAGEQLAGCKQNRVVNASIMVPPHADMPLPVTCAERGRWGYSSSSFSSAHTSSHHKLRHMMATQATQGYRKSGKPQTDQVAVWGEVSRKLETMGSSSSSDALQEVFGNYDAKLKQFVDKLPAPEDSNGAVFVIGGNIAGADMFDSPETLRKLWPKLVKSCTIDALEPSPDRSGSTAPDEVLRWLDGASRAQADSFPSAGVGQDLRIEGEAVVGSCLLVDDHPVHIELFRRAEQGATDSTGLPFSEDSEVSNARPSREPMEYPRDHSNRLPSWLRRFFS